KNKYNNYEPHPVKKIEGFEHSAWDGGNRITEELKRKLKERPSSRTVLCFDYYPGVDKQELAQLAKELGAAQIIDMDKYAKNEEQLEKEFYDYITDDRVFGVICHKKLKDFYREEGLEECRKKLEAIQEGLIVLIGFGTGLVCDGDLHIYCSITRWEIQLRYRDGMPNWNHTNVDMPVLEKYKRGFFVEWRLADRYKKQYYNKFDYVLETEEKNHPKMITGEAYRAVLCTFAKEPFRLEPYFDPGVWGGHWMQENFNLDKTKANFAWSFDGVPEENSINASLGDVCVKLPAIDVVLYQPVSLLGNRVHARFGAEFPIRFDMLDTMGGGNLSLQVHPLTEYIQDTFGMHYTQDESYYILDADEEEQSYVYLGLKDQVDRDKMAEDLRRAQSGECAFPAEEYVNKVPIKKHDHVLIPAGTIHCSGQNVMVLEISATPYIFTFKLWDWGRLGLDGRPRPIHVEHGLKNIQWDRNTDFVYNNLIHMEKTLEKTDSALVERTGLHEREFLDTVRYNLKAPYEVTMEDTVHVMNLVEGSSAIVQSVDGSFEPFEVHYAETVIVPASVGSYVIVPRDREGKEIKMIVASIR
ncbi:MAG: class I mannose-6-phosphate isomerase, partial [Acetatifactor sp.]|nr:class I mannose-6-phosphate isomerase [Acetatifactor sp.]